jgi:photosystem II stability/assembly factor-like uncharacterized protein
MRLIPPALLALATVCAAAQSSEPAPAVWQMQESGTTAGLRGIDSADGTVAWASGTGGTVLKTVDGGAHWARCAVPGADQDGATLDFRGVQGWNATTAIVMSSGPGNKSRLFKTTDGCRTWALLFANPDAPNGFFDSFWLSGSQGMLLGDPVGGQFAVFTTKNGGKTWIRDRRQGLSVNGRSLAAFAASNSCIAVGNRLFARGFVTGGANGALFFSRLNDLDDAGPGGILVRMVRKKTSWKSSRIAVAGGTESAGAFSVHYRYPVTSGICEECGFGENSIFVAAGGDYTKPNDSKGTAAWSADGGVNWTPAAKPPHGYRSAVQWSETLKIWIAAGANGSDMSRDDGKTWTALDDGNWNALSLPFAVGPNGRIARLNAAALPVRTK